MSTDILNDEVDSTVDILEKESQRKLIQLRRLFLIIVLLSPLLWMYYLSCKKSGEINSTNDQPINPAIARRIDSIALVAKRYSILNHDSCEITLLYSIRFQDSMKATQKKLDTYREIVEFYQNYKPDNLKALKSLLKAVEIFIANPEPYASNPYFFVDIGNVFYHFHLFKQAIKFYQIAFEVGKQNPSVHAQALALNNIGLAYQNQGYYHKALQCFLYANQHIVDPSDPRKALSYNYIARVLVICRDTRYVKALANRSIEVLNNYYKNNFRTAASKKCTYYFQWNEFKSKAHTNLGLYFNLLQQNDSADYHFARASLYAKASGTKELQANVFLNLALYYRNGDLQESTRNADTAIQLVSKLNDMYVYKTFCDTLTSVFGKRHVALLETKYALLGQLLRDSIIKQKASLDFIESQILISSVASEQAIQDLNEKKAVQNDVIQHKNQIIWFVSIISLVILLALFLLYKRFQKLRDAYKGVTHKIRQSLMKDAGQAEKKIIAEEVRQQLIFDLGKIMQDEKPYLRKNFSLDDLASLLRTNHTYVSALIREQHRSNFNQYINQLRIKESCRMLTEANYKTLSVDEIMENCGFNSRSAFYVSFKKYTGMNPVDFRKTNLESTNKSNDEA